MDVLIEKIKICYRAVTSWLKVLKENPQDTLVFIVVSLVVVLLCWLTSACSSHHYFSINAEEITNPEIMYSDSTTLTNPF